MNNKTNNDYINIEISENAKEILSELHYFKVNKSIKLSLSDKFGYTTVISIFDCEKLEKSLKKLYKLMKAKIPDIDPKDWMLIEEEILTNATILYEHQNEEHENIIEEKVEQRPDISIDEWRSTLVEKYEKLKEIVNKNFPEIWQILEFSLSVKNILHINNNSLPFAGIILGPASSSKTLSLEMLRKIPITFYTDSFTPRSFVSHNTSVSLEQLEKIDMLPKIKNKLLITPELSPLFSARDDDIIQTLGIITRILDGNGYESDSGAYGHRGYKDDIMFTWLGAAVDIPRKVYRHLAYLGPKLYFFRMIFTEKTSDELIDELLRPSFLVRKTETEAVLMEYLKWFDYCPDINRNSEPMKINCNNSNVNKDVLLHIVNLGKLLSHLRGVTQTWETKATQGSDYAYTTPIKELPSRAIYSLKNLALGHALITGRTYITIEDIPIVIKTVLSTAPIDRVKVFDLLLNTNGILYTSQIIEFLGISRPTAHKTMTELKILGLVDLDKDSEIEANNAPKHIKLKEEFEWFLSKEFKQLREGYIPKKFEKECKEKTSSHLQDLNLITNDLLKSIFWNEFYKIANKANTNTNNESVINPVFHDDIVQAIIQELQKKEYDISEEKINNIIETLLKEGSLVKEDTNKYYKSTSYTQKTIDIKNNLLNIDNQMEVPYNIYKQ